MTRKPVTVSPQSSIEQASELMLKHGIGSLPVLNNAELVGIITWKDLLRAYTN